MRKQFIILAACLIPFTLPVSGQTISISDARSQGAGSNVTISGILTNGSELGTIRYIQDGTGGMAIYSYSFSQVAKRGDSVTVAGTIKDYNNLLELDPVSSWDIHSSGHEMPAPPIISPGEMGESYESELVRIEDVTFQDGGTTFSSGTYSFSDGAESGIIYIRNNHPLIGTLIPTGQVSLVGICHHFYDTYELLLRDQNDIFSGTSINLTGPVSLSNLTQSGFTLSWTTDVPGTSELKYGHTPELELGILTDPASTTAHDLTISGLSPADLVYVQVFSYDGNDTAWSGLLTYITQSASTGEMIVYFNRQVDHSVSSGVDAIPLEQTLDDTLIAYLGRAKYSIDFTIYNFNNSGISNISQALNNAHNRGVQVRVVYDSNTDNAGIDELDVGIGKIASPVSSYPDYGIMHNKFIVIDAGSADPNDAIVWTGSTNFTNSQINTDPNNVVIIQDQSLARVYTLEFEEMFGTSGLQPDPGNARFGPDKLDNTPHELVIGGKRVECFFSPSDGTNARILNAILSAGDDLSAATMIPTRTDLGYAIRDASEDGAEAKVLVNSDTDPNMETNITTLSVALGGNFRKTGESGIMHHKYLIADQSNPDSDPLVLTGSHNWSNSAEYRNDENTIIVHDATIANIFYQEFTERFKHGLIIANAPECKNDYVTTSEDTPVTEDVTANDDIPGDFDLAIIRHPANGTASSGENKNITYEPVSGFTGLDTVTYEVCLTSNGSLCDSAWMVIYVQETTAIHSDPERPVWQVYPNPASDELNVLIDIEMEKEIGLEIIDLTGKILMSYERKAKPGPQHIRLSLSGLQQGMYFVKLRQDQIYAVKKVVIE
jgi:phosphatidylserine/phosphatidylglycerophosphate/cardiolipin synthase-like enzyme